MTLDESDREPVRLVSDLLTAASLSGLDELGAGLEPLRASALRAEPLTLVDSLLEMLYDTAVPLTLVLDDLQHLAESKASVRVIDHVLRWAPANMRIAIAARVVPPLRLQRLRLEDRLAYIAHDELAFSPEESAEAVRAAGLDLDRRHRRHHPRCDRRLAGRRPHGDPRRPPERPAPPGPDGAAT